MNTKNSNEKSMMFTAGESNQIKKEIITDVNQIFQNNRDLLSTETPKKGSYMVYYEKEGKLHSFSLKNSCSSEDLEYAEKSEEENLMFDRKKSQIPGNQGVIFSEQSTAFASPFFALSQGKDSQMAYFENDHSEEINLNNELIPLELIKRSTPKIFSNSSKSSSEAKAAKNLFIGGQSEATLLKENSSVFGIMDIEECLNGQEIGNEFTVKSSNLQCCSKDIQKNTLKKKISMLCEEEKKSLYFGPEPVFQN